MKHTTCMQLVNNLEYLYSTVPHAAKKIETYWGTRYTHRYLKNLLIKDRDIRQGFPKKVYNEIFLIYLLHYTEYGDYNEPLTLVRPNVATH